MRGYEKSSKPRLPSKPIGTIIETPTNELRNAQLSDQIRVDNNLPPRNGGRDKEIARFPVSSATEGRTRRNELISSQPSKSKLVSGRVKMLELSLHQSIASERAPVLAPSLARDSSSLSPLAQGAMKRPRVDPQGIRDTSLRPLALKSFASTATAAGAQAARALQSVVEPDDGKRVQEIDSDNSNDEGEAAKDVAVVIRQRQLLPTAAMRPHHRRANNDPDYASGHQRTGGDTLSESILAKDSIALPTSPQASHQQDSCAQSTAGASRSTISERAQRNVSGFSGKYTEPATPASGIKYSEAHSFFSPPASSPSNNARVGQTPEKLVSLLRPKLNRDEGGVAESNEEERLSRLPRATMPASSSRAREILARSYVGELEPPRSSVSPRRRQSSAGQFIDLRSPSQQPDNELVFSPPPKPQPHTQPKSTIRRQSQNQQPKLASVPAKAIYLRGVQIGKHLQIADAHTDGHNQGEPSPLKLTIRYVQNTMEISGLGEKRELLKIFVPEISALHYYEQRGLTVMRITPNGTMENIFEVGVFDPTCGDSALSLIYLYWDSQGNGDKVALTRLTEHFGHVIKISTLDKKTYETFVHEFTKLGSIDLISSDDDGSVAVGDSKAAMGTDISSLSCENGNVADAPETARVLSPSTSHYWSSVDSSSKGTLLGRSEVKGRQGKAKSDDDNDLWKMPAMCGKQPVFHKSAGYGLRKTNAVNMAEPPSLFDDDFVCGSDDDSIAEHQAARPDVSGLRFEYPPDTIKSISVVGSDICRLFAGEFLNDTIIEFYLRYIGESLRAANAGLYEKCFFFNTFFFKKLSQRSRAIASSGNTDPMDAVYGQLKKWTASVELFDKDYVFVPINENVHWYLAIICNPRVLLADSATALQSDVAGDSSEDTGEAATTNDATSLDQASPLADLSAAEESVMVQPRAHTEAMQDSASPLLEDDSGDVEMAEAATPIGEMGGAPVTQTPATPPQQKQPLLAPALESAGSVSCLGSSSPLQQVANLLQPQVLELGLDEDEVQVGPQPDSSKREVAATTIPIQEAVKAKNNYLDPLTTPCIIILDSLGNRHQPTFGLLRGYMQAEASFRHRLVNAAEGMVGKYAKVPLQNNFCDCGVFLLHYVEEFLKDPTKFMALALNGISMREWFDPGLMRKKRSDMLDLAARLANDFEQQQRDKLRSKESAIKDEAPSAADIAEEAAGQTSDSPVSELVTETSLI